MGGQDSAQTFPAVSRRGFLAAGGAGVVGLSLRESLAAQSNSGGAVIQIVLSGGASHLETFDPKPHAPREIRGPLHSISTKITGVRFSECLPKLAERADQLVILRSLFHEAAPIHETGLQLLLTGHLANREISPPHLGFVLGKLLKARRGIPVAVELGGPLRCTGTAASVGETDGILSESDSPHYLPCPADLSDQAALCPDFAKADRRVREAYGETRFGKLFWTAARLIESGVRYVPVNTFSRLEGESTWDAHGCPKVGPATVFDYRDTLGPQFDCALAALLDDLHQSGMWQQTLIAVSGEMGRSPRMNENGGRDHWTQAWSGLLAGGMLPVGQVIGETDEHGESILNLPIEISSLPSLLLESLGVSPGTEFNFENGSKLTTPVASPLFA